jgi:hypothetical protein
MKITDIKPNPNNPRLIKTEKFLKLVERIRAFPKMLELRPIVVNDEMVILGGNMRYRALKELKYTEIPDSWVKKATDLTEEEREQFIILDNVEFGEWAFEILSEHFDLGKVKEWGVDIVMPDDFSDKFQLPSGDKAPFQQMTFTLSDMQAEHIQQASSLKMAFGMTIPLK